MMTLEQIRERLAEYPNSDTEEHKRITKWMIAFFASMEVNVPLSFRQERLIDKHGNICRQPALVVVNRVSKDCYHLEVIPLN